MHKRSWPEMVGSPHTPFLSLGLVTNADHQVSAVRWSVGVCSRKLLRHLTAGLNLLASSLKIFAREPKAGMEWKKACTEKGFEDL